ncbi:MAG: Ig-like domain-containing protein, partial [Clostridia bacterium]|nr:Ig-like domain-containing protein [Clostridia bacterium]
MKRKLIALICILALLLPMAVMPTSAAAYTYTSSSTGAPNANTDYSFAVIGDMQIWTELDQESNGTTAYTKTVFDWLLQNKDSRKIKYVFELGDTVDTLISWPTNGYNTSVTNPRQWQIAAEQFARLEGKIPYMVIRGNHDDEAGFHKYICTDDYKNRMSGFCYDPNEAAVYGNSMSNSYQKIEIGGVKYLMLGLDFHLHETCIDGNPCENSARVITWANNVIAANPEYRVMVSVHVYENANGSFYKGTVGEPGTKRYDTWPAGWNGPWQETIDFSGEYLWENIFKYHENIFMIMSGHVVTQNPYFGTRTDTKHNNSVFEIVNDPSNYVTTNNGNNTHIMMLNFDEDGNVLGVEYLSPSRALKGESKYYAGSSNQHKVNYSDVGVVDLKNAFSSLGHTNPVVKMSSNAAPVLDGVINESEYTTKRVIAQNGPYAQNLESDLVEYIRHDNEYIYYAFKVKQTRSDRATQLQFRVQNSYAFPGYLALHNRHVTTSFIYHESTGTIEYGTNDSNQPGVSAPVWGQDIWAAATKDAGNYKTGEIKISKEYFAKQLGIDKSELEYIAYGLYLHTNSSGAEQWNVYKVTSSVQNVLTSLGVTKSISNIYHVMQLDSEGVSLNKTSLALDKGASETLRATVTPSNYSGGLTWTSSNTSVATVSTSGVVTAKAKGTATITVKTASGITATCTVTVNSVAESVTLNNSTLSLNKGGTATLVATIAPSDASNKTVTWTSSNTSVATVSTSGVVTAKAGGTATITVRTANGKTATCTVTVSVPATGVTLNNSTLSLNKGATATLVATITPTDASNKTLTWTSSNTSVATVSTSGVVTAKANGTATITVRTANGKTATCTVTVTVPVTGVTLNQSTLSLNKGGTA